MQSWLPVNFDPSTNHKKKEKKGFLSEIKRYPKVKRVKQWAVQLRVDRLEFNQPRDQKSAQCVWKSHFIAPLGITLENLKTGLYSCWPVLCWPVLGSSTSKVWLTCFLFRAFGKLVQVILKTLFLFFWKKNLNEIGEAIRYYQELILFKIELNHM